MLFELPNPAIFAHRGSSKHAPENTLAAFRLAVQQGADAIELDADLTRDEQVIVIHDDSVDRTTNGRGRVSYLTLEEIRRLDAGSFFAPEFASERVPLLAEVFAAVGGQIRINVELKNYRNPLSPLAARVAQVVRQFGLEREVIFSAFNPLSLTSIHRLLPDVPTALLALSGQLGRLALSPIWRGISPTMIHINQRSVTPELITQQHAWGRRVHVYTVDEPAELLRDAGWGVDGFFTNDPLTARQTLPR